MLALDRAAAQIQGRRHPAVHAQRLAPGCRAYDIRNRIHRAHFVKVNIFDGNGVNRRLNLTQQLEGAAGALLHRRGDRRSANDRENRRQRPMRRVRVFVRMGRQVYFLRMVLVSVRFV